MYFNFILWLPCCQRKIVTKKFNRSWYWFLIREWWCYWCFYSAPQKQPATSNCDLSIFTIEHYNTSNLSEYRFFMHFFYGIHTYRAFSKKLLNTWERFAVFILGAHLSLYPQWNNLQHMKLFNKLIKIEEQLQNYRVLSSDVSWQQWATYQRRTEGQGRKGTVYRLYPIPTFMQSRGKNHAKT